MPAPVSTGVMSTSSSRSAISSAAAVQIRIEKNRRAVPPSVWARLRRSSAW